MIRQCCAVVVGVGASHGIGAAVSRRIGHEGLLVYVAGRTPEKLEGVVAEIQQAGGQAESYILDATKVRQVDALFSHINARQQAIAQTCWHIYQQPCSAWSQELSVWK